MNEPKQETSKKQTFLTIVGLIIIIALCFGVYMLLKFIWNSVKDYPTITVAIITGFLSIVTIVVQRVWEKRYKQEQDIRNQKMQHIREWLKNLPYFFSMIQLKKQEFT